MITDPTKAEINLFNALTELDKAFRNDGTCIESGIQTFLRKHEVGGYTPQVVKILVERNLVKKNPKGTRRFPLIYYNATLPPSLDLCRDIFETIRRRQRMKEAMKNQPKEKTIEELSMKNIIDLPDPDPKEDVILEMKADVLKQLEYHSAEQLKYKTIYEYLNQKS